MTQPQPQSAASAQRLLVVMPSWVGDAVMAMPTLRALRELYPKAQITVLAKAAIRPIIDACPWVDRIITFRLRRTNPEAGRGVRRRGMMQLARRLAARRFDLGILLPNSFRSALLLSLAGVKRKVGYDRDGRGFLLTDRLLPQRDADGFIPVPTLEYYLGVARYLGVKSPDPHMRLFTRGEDDAAAAALISNHRTADGPLIVITPGANYGQAKMWPADRFAQVAAMCRKNYNACVAVGGSPNEKPIINDIVKQTGPDVINLAELNVSLKLFKSVIKQSQLVITNDTGPRHIAAAMGVPVVTIFGPTDPAWTHIPFAHERQLQVDVPCGPCQKKICPLRGTPEDHQCMTLIEPDMVMQQVRELLAAAVS